MVAKSMLTDDSGTTTMEYALIMAAIAVPFYFIFQTALKVLMGYYAMMTLLNGWPFP